MSSLDFEHDEPDEVLRPMQPAPDQDCETATQRLDRMLRWQADLVRRHARATDPEERERMQRLIRQREVGVAYQRAVVAGAAREQLRKFIGSLGQ